MLVLMVIEKFTYFLDFKIIQMQKSLHFNIELTSLLRFKRPLKIIKKKDKGTD